MILKTKFLSRMHERLTLKEWTRVNGPYPCVRVIVGSDECESLGLPMSFGTAQGWFCQGRTSSRGYLNDGGLPCLLTTMVVHDRDVESQGAFEHIIFCLEATHEPGRDHMARCGCAIPALVMVGRRASRGVGFLRVCIGSHTLLDRMTVNEHFSTRVVGRSLKIPPYVVLLRWWTSCSEIERMAEARLSRNCESVAWPASAQGSPSSIECSLASFCERISGPDGATYGLAR